MHVRFFSTHCFGCINGDALYWQSPKKERNNSFALHCEMHTALSACLPVCLSACLFACLAGCLSVCLSVCQHHVSWQVQGFVCLGSRFSWQAQYFEEMQAKNCTPHWKCEAQIHTDIPNLKEASRNCFVFKLHSLQTCRKSRRKCMLSSLCRLN